MAATATVVKECKTLVHNGVERVPCGTKYKGSECPKKALHVHKFKTGFCANGFCEGTKPKSFSGKPVKTCEHWMTCGCDCHTLIDEMMKMAEMVREEVPNPEYVPTPRTWWMPEDDPTFDVSQPLSSFDGTDTPGTDERPSNTPPNGAHGPLRPVSQPVFAATPTGRRARGQLEYDVLSVCIDFANDVFDWTECTPKLVSERIGKLHAEEPPSTGAINAVWDRWEKLGFAEQAKKPSRFVRFLGDGSIQNLERIKAQAKRSRKRGEAEARRNPQARR